VCCLYCNHQVDRDFLITLYFPPWENQNVGICFPKRLYTLSVTFFVSNFKVPILRHGTALQGNHGPVFRDNLAISFSRDIMSGKNTQHHLPSNAVPHTSTDTSTTPLQNTKCLQDHFHFDNYVSKQNLQCILPSIPSVPYALVLAWLGGLHVPMTPSATAAVA
jgi:hypothetical protein